MLITNCLRAFRSGVKVPDMSVIYKDRFRIHVKAGRGGQGLIKYNGIGGDGGDIYIRGKKGMRFVQVLTQIDDSLDISAESGSNSKQIELMGKKGKEFVLNVPVGVEAIHEGKNLVIAKCDKNGQKYLVANGGDGGKIANGFVGEKGDNFHLILNLKLDIDIGLIGFPNAGKSTVLKCLTPKKQIKIANYPFTTERPQVCHLKYDSEPGDDGLFSLSIVDLPGLIEGAHNDRGKGHKFLKHVENATIILMVVDCTGFKLENGPFRSPLETIGLLNKEMEIYNPILLQKPIILCLNKIDLATSSENADEIERIIGFSDWSERLPQDCRPFNPIHFKSVIKTAAKNGHLNGLQRILKNTYDNLYDSVKIHYDFDDKRTLRQLL